MVIEKIDFTLDGRYDSYKYGETDASGDVIFHTLIQEASATHQYEEKDEQERKSKKFQLDFVNGFTNVFALDWELFSELIYESLDPYEIYAKKEIKTETTVSKTIDESYYLIQRDTNGDGQVDKEFTQSIIFSSLSISTKTREKATLYFQPDPIYRDILKIIGYDLKGSEEHIRQYYTSEYYDFNSEFSLIFRDFEEDIAVSSRVYQDSFPNEIADLYNPDNHLKTVVNDMGDYDIFNDVVMQVHDKDPLLSLSHSLDNVPAMFDSLSITADGYTKTENILSSTETVNVFGGHNVLTGLFSQGLTSELIKVAPKDGVYYDNIINNGPEKIDGFYFYMDGDADNWFETIFTADKKGNLMAVGFDYDYDSYFVPHARDLVNIHTTRMKFSEREGLINDIFYNVEDLISHELLDFNEEDGTFLKQTFSDSMFDLWKIQYSEGSTELFDDVSELTFNKFMETLTPEKIKADFFWQLTSVGIAKAVGAKFGPLGFALTYASLNILKGLNDQEEQDNILNAKTFHDSDNYRGAETLSEKLWFDDIFGSSITTAFIGNKFGVYAPVAYETEKYKYEGQIVLAPMDFGESKTEMEFAFDKIFDSSNYGLDAVKGQYVPKVLDYSFQTRNYMGYSDLDDKRCEDLIKMKLNKDANKASEDDLGKILGDAVNYIVSGDIINPMGPTGGPVSFIADGMLENLEVYNNLWYADQSIMSLENAVYGATEINNDLHLDKIIPYMYDYYPTFTFSDVKSPAPLPEFYEDYPVIVSEESFEAGLGEIYDNIYKIWEKGDGTSIRIVPEDSRHVLRADIDHIDVYVINTYVGGGPRVKEFERVKKFATLTGSDYSFDEATGQLILDSSVINDFKSKINDEIENNDDYAYCIALDIFVEKYRSMEDTSLPPEEITRITSMQAVQAAILEYYYQFQIATEAQEKLNELAYTVMLTVMSTAVLTRSPTAVLTETMEELFLDPVIEASVSGITRYAGRALGYEDTRSAEIIFSTIAETGRESVGGVATQAYQSYQQRQTNKIYKKLGIDSKIVKDGKKLEKEVAKEQKKDPDYIPDAATMTALIFSRALQDVDQQLRKMKSKELKELSKKSSMEILGILIGKTQISIEQDSKINAKTYDSKLTSLFHFYAQMGKILKLTDGQKQKKSITIDMLKKLSALSTLGSFGAPGYTNSFMSKFDKKSELSETGKYETFSVSEPTEVQQFLKDRDLDPTKLKVLINGKETTLKDVINPEDEITVYPTIAGNLELPSFRVLPRSHSNRETKLVQKLIDIIHAYEPQIINLELKLEQKLGLKISKKGKIYRNHYDEIRAVEIAKIIGVSEEAIRSWLKRLREGGEIHQFHGPWVVTTMKTHLELFSKLPGVYKSFIKAFNDYDTVVDKILEIFNEYLDVPPKNTEILFYGISKEMISSTLNKYSEYLGSFRRQIKIVGQYEEFQKYFKLLVLIHLIEINDLPFPLKEGKELVDLKQDCHKLIFETMRNKKMIKDVTPVGSGTITDSIKNRMKVGQISIDNSELFDIIVYSLVALSKAHRMENKKDSSYIFKYNDLSEVIAVPNKKNTRYIINNKFNKGHPLLRAQGRRLVTFLRKNIHNNPQGLHDVIYKIRKHIERHEKFWYWKKYDIHFNDLFVPQMKSLFDSTLGLNVFGNDFFSDIQEHVTRSGYVVKGTYVVGRYRHHLEKGTAGYLILERLGDGELRFRLVPLTRDEHDFVHSLGVIEYQKNMELLNARLSHLYKLINSKQVSLKDFRNEELNGIWADFSDDVLNEWIERQKMSEEDFYKKYYPDFYEKIYLPFMKDYELYKAKDPNSQLPEFWYWYPKYLGEEQL